MTPIPFVDTASIRPSLATRTVSFRVRDGQTLDMATVRKALAAAGSPKVTEL